jgi:hypothetical protein
MKLRKLVTMREALASPLYFGDLLSGDSWRAWRILLIAIVGEKLTKAERVFFKELTGRDCEPGEPVEEFWGIIGRRGGKTRATAVLAAYLATCIDYRGILAPGERGVIPLLAASVQQAASAFAFIEGIFTVSPNLKDLVDGATSDTIGLTTGVDIEVRPASFRTIRGITAIAVIADELAFWRSDDSANPDREILKALRPSLATTGGPLIAISSPHAKRGELFNTWKRHYGPEGDPLILVAKAPTRAMNPSLSQRVIDRAIEADPEAASAEYMAEWRGDLDSCFDPEAIAACVVTGLTVRAPLAGVTYRGHCDPSGGSGDAMTLAIGHLDNGRPVLDCVLERRAPFNPDDVTREFSETLKQYGVARVTGDRYGGSYPAERFAAYGVHYEPAELNRSELYLALLPLVNSHGVDLLDNKRMISQFCALERRTARSGKDSVDHPPQGHDDISNSVAGVIVDLNSDRRPALVRKDAMLRAGEGYPFPMMAQYIVAFLIVDDRGTAATIYAGQDAPAPGALHIIDFDIAPLAPDIFAVIGARLRELCSTCRVLAGWQLGAAVWVGPGLLPHAGAAGLSAHEIPSDFKAEDKLISVSRHVAAGMVRICAPALEKARNSAFSGALDLRMGEDVENPLRRALVSTVSLTLDVAESTGPAKWGFGRAA